MVRFESVSKKFENRVIINNVTFSIDPNSSTAILGESGAGKTTVLRMMNGLDKPTQGRILIDGDAINNNNIKNVRFKIGFVFQNFNLFPHLTAMQNICIAPREVLQWEECSVIEKAELLLKKFCLFHIKDYYNKQLSGGQRQRIAIIRALMMNPKVILLDEPTSALDPNMVNEVGETIELLKASNVTVIMVTHNAKFVKKYCSKILFCSNGNVDSFLIEDFFASKREDIENYIRHEF